MTTSRIVLEQITNLQEASGTNEKVALIKEYLKEDLFKEIVILALDPMITFGVKDIAFIDEALIENEDITPKTNRALSADNVSTHSFFRVLRKLSDRTLSGSNARIAIRGLVMDYDEDTTQILKYILMKDLRASTGASLFNKAVPGTMFEFNVMLAAKYEPNKVEMPCYVEPKYDGMRLVAIGDQDGFEFYTRTGKVVDTVSPKVKGALAQMYAWGTDTWKPKSKMVFDGELMGDSFRDTMKKARKKGGTFESGNFYVFDALTIEEFQGLKRKGVKTESYVDRRAKLNKVYTSYIAGYEGIQLPPSYLCRNTDDILEFYTKFRDRGLEGLIIKSGGGFYHPRRNRDWMKMKDVQSVDVPVVDAVEGTGKFVGSLGALVIDCEGVIVNVGSGFSDSDRKDIWESWNKGWLKDKIIEVEYHEKTPDGSLRHPRFKCFRDDKTLECGIGV